MSGTPADPADGSAAELVADRYVLGEHLGAGAIGEVYAAHDRMLERAVALKFLHRHLASDPETVDRFCREARAIAQLSHPNVLHVYDFESDNEPPFIVLERVDGVTLAELLRTAGQLEEADWRAFAVQLLDGLAAAHDRGVVHRDVKPANLLVETGGTLRIADFGLARTTDMQTITADGVTLGTAAYMSPEQARGDTVDHRTDVYSAGCVIFELITGRPPFTASGVVEAVMQHLNEPAPDVREFRDDVDPAAADAVAAMLSKDLDDRPTTAREAARMFEAASVGEVRATAALGQTIRARVSVLGMRVASAPADANLYGGFVPRNHPNLGRAPMRTRVGDLQQRARGQVDGWNHHALADAAKVLATLALVAFVAWAMVRGDDAARNAPVPDFVGQSTLSARTEAQQAGWRLRAREVDARAAAGTVVRQEPSPGSRAAQGDVVDVWIAR